MPHVSNFCSGTTFSFPLSDGKLTDKYVVAPDLSESYPSPINIDDHAAVKPCGRGSHGCRSSLADRAIAGRCAVATSRR
jgi:hypothetical protein